MQRRFKCKRIQNAAVGNLRWKPGTWKTPSLNESGNSSLREDGPSSAYANGDALLRVFERLQNLAYDLSVDRKVGLYSRPSSFFELCGSAL